jgi:SnoaL-like domain
MSEDMEKMVRRLSDVHEIQNLMGRYEFLTTANLFTETVELFAKTVPQKIEIGPLGVWDGMDAAWRCFHGFHNWTSKIGVPIEGQMMQHTLATPVVEVAKDGQTAKGVWMSPGHEARVLGGKLTALWVWGTYGEDFIREEGGWKIRNHHVYLNIITPYDVPWTAEKPGDPGDIGDIFPPGLPDEYKPNRPSTYAWMYSPQAVMELVPVPPDPHDSYDPSTDYVQ